MRIRHQTAMKIAHRFSDEIVEAVESELGIEFGDDRGYEAVTEVEMQLAELIREVFEDA